MESPVSLFDRLFGRSITAEADYVVERIKERGRYEREAAKYRLLYHDLRYRLSSHGVEPFVGVLKQYDAVMKACGVEDAHEN